MPIPKSRRRLDRTREPIDDEGIRLAKEYRVYLVMDIYNDDYILGKAIEFGLPKENVEKEKMVGRITGQR